MSQTYKSDELGEYDFGQAGPPEGFNPEATGYRDPPVGEHVVYLTDYEVAPDHEFKSREGRDGPTQTFVLNQLRPRLIVAAGQHAGATIIDFLPMPTPGREWCANLANRWANFLAAFGFKPAANRVVPPGFQLGQLKGDAKRGPFARVTIVRSMNADGQPRLKRDGSEQRQIKYFGYARPSPAEAGGGSSSAAAGAAVATPSAPAGPAAAAGNDWEL